MRLLAAIALSFLLAAGALAVEPAPVDAAPGLPRNIQFETFSISEGLPQVVVTAIAQDRRGYLWIGTQEGLSRHDGYEFTNFYHDADDPGSISNDYISSLFVDRGGALWVGTDGGGLNRFDEDTGSFVRYRHNQHDPASLASDRVRVIEQDDKGLLWIGSDGAGLSRMDPATGRFTHHLDGPVAQGGLASKKILDLVPGQDGVLWVGTDGAGLYRLNWLTGQLLIYRNDPGDDTSISSDRIRSVFEDPNGKLWVGTLGGGVSILEPGVGAFRRFHHDYNDPGSLGHDMVRGFYRDSGGTLWVATDGGLSQWMPEQEQFLTYRHDPTDPSSLVDDRVNTLFQDRSGSLWVGTFNGLSKWNYVSDAFAFYRLDHNGVRIKNNIVTSIATGGDGSAWVGTYGGGLIRLDLNSGSMTHYEHDPDDDQSLSSDRIMAVFVDESGMVWAGTRDSGLNRLDPESGRAEQFRHDPAVPGSISANAITRIHGGVDGTLWVGTYGGGLNRLDRNSGEFETYRHDPNDPSSISSDRVLALLSDQSGVPWVGTEDGGLNALDESTGTFRRFRHDPVRRDSLGSDFAWEILEGQDGSLWVGTNGGGLNRWLPENRAAGRDIFKRYGKQNGLASSAIQGLLEDRDGSIWISSNKGLSRLDVATGQVRHFDSQNGLGVDDFIQGSRAMTKSGRLLFGGSGGLVAFSSDRVRSNTFKPPVVVTAYKRMIPVGRSFSADTQAPTIDLSYTDYSVTFEFSALDFNLPKDNRYRYRLGGFDDEWIESGSYRRATYTSLPAGTFQFQVQGANNDGVWNTQSADLNLRVSPPPWRSTWAYALYVIAAFAVLLTLARAERRKLAQEAAQRLKLEEQVRQRTAELYDRNAELEDLANQLRLTSVTDSLTGLKNRRYLQEFIGPEIAQIARVVRDRGVKGGDDHVPDISPALFFTMIDLDGFKTINDTHGHSAGDMALKQTCELLRHSCRSSDTLIRWGGDEFLVVGHGANRSAIERIAERIRKQVFEHRYQLGGGAIGRLSTSIGVSIYPFASADPESIGWERIVAVADQAAYIAKKNQGNAWVGIYPGSRFTSKLPLETTNIPWEEMSRNGEILIRSSIQTELVVSGQKSCVGV